MPRKAGRSEPFVGGAFDHLANALSCRRWCYGATGGNKLDTPKRAGDCAAHVECLGWPRDFGAAQPSSPKGAGLQIAAQAVSATPWATTVTPVARVLRDKS